MKGGLDEQILEDGEHWISPITASLEAATRNHKCSPEVYVLLGITKGIQKGTITMGDPVYREIALRVEGDGYREELYMDVMELGKVGLFSPCKISYWDHNNAPEPAIDPNDRPECWAGQYSDNLGDIKFANPLAEAMLNGICNGIHLGVIKHGDPAAAQMLLESVKQLPRFEDKHGRILEQFAEAGFFGNELLMGCEPDRATAVSRLR